MTPCSSVLWLTLPAKKNIGYNCICVLLIVHMCSSVTAVFIRSGFGYQLIDRTRPLASWRFAISPSPTRSDPRTLACFRRIDQKPERDGAWNTRLTNRNRNDSHSQHEWHVLRGWAQTENHFQWKWPWNLWVSLQKGRVFYGFPNLPCFLCFPKAMRICRIPSSPLYWEPFPLGSLKTYYAISLWEKY